MVEVVRRSVLHERHVTLGAKFSTFAGWQMPREYASGLAEHAAVRTACGLFDVSHLGKVRVRGSGAAAYLNTCLTGDLDRIGAGRAQYTLCCNQSGGIVDDLIIYRFGDDELLLVPNAANASAVAALLTAAAPAGIEITDQHLDFAVLAVQGPGSAQLLAAAGLPAGLSYTEFTTAGSAGDVIVCRTGYTGELGYELIVPVAQAVAVWDTLLAAGAGPTDPAQAEGAQTGQVRPCGLSARDTLRTEMGYPLHGQDITPQISPLEAGLSWAVGWRKPAFWGRDALLAQREQGPTRKLVGLLALEPGVLRAGPESALQRPATAEQAALAATDPYGPHSIQPPVGRITSGTFSPTRRVGIALALVDTDVAIGEQLIARVRSRHIPVEVVKPPFVDASPK